MESAASFQNKESWSKIRILCRDNKFDMRHVEFEVQVRYPGRVILQAIWLYEYGACERNLWVYI